MSQLVSVDGFANAMKELLDEYGQSITKKANEVIPTVAKEAVKQMKASSRSSLGGTGKYAQGWRQKTTEDRLLGVESVIYNSMGGLPHLLEFGHVLKAGGRTVGDVKGKEHIYPVEQWAVKQVVDKLKEELSQ